MLVRKDCRYFRGDVPCKPHKKEGVHCEDCSYYSPVGKKILILKLGAVGDVIRTTPLLHKLKKEYLDGEIYWLTYYPEVLPGIVDNPLSFELKNILYLQATRFDLLINLDKDREACALANMIEADLKKGFMLESGKCVPIDDAARHKWLTGLSDDLSKSNSKSYPEEIFEICGYKFNKEKYIFEINDRYKWNINEQRPLIGLNTGCGERWLTRLWPLENWVQLSKELKASGYGVLLLGGESEDKRNKQISKESGAMYLGHFPLDQFFSLVNQCDLVVTAVSMALHVAVGLGKRIVLLNNIFNKSEFELYGLGEILEPDVNCKGCYRSRFDSKCEVPNCMELISPENVLEAIRRLV